MTLWLYLHFPTLQLDSLFSDIQQAPICILNKQYIVQINSVAEEKGIKLGMGLGSAASLCADLQVHPYNQQVEEQKLTEIAHWLYMVTSDISLFSPSGILLKVSNMLTLYDGLASYWSVVFEHLTSLNIQFSFSTGSSPLSAKLLAQQQINRISDDPIWLQNTLKQQPLHATELTDKTVEQLNRVGVRYLQDLLTLELADIARRFDIELVNYMGRLTGQLKHPVSNYHPAETFKRHLELLFEIDNVQWLIKPLFTLLTQLEAFLLLRDKVAYQLTLQLHQRGDLTQSVTFSSAQGDYLATKWQQLSKLTLESCTLNAPITAITLYATQTHQKQSDGHDLFDGQQGQTSPLELISILQAKLGKEQVTGVSKTRDPRPELATRLSVPFAPQHDDQRVDQSEKTASARPSILFPSPVPLAEKVTILQGPERLTTGWWDAETIMRDYFVAKSDQGRWLWVFRDQQKQWFIHGLFA
ncbi:nucleotidyltransferase [Vibrio sp. MACH09]|uniref:Y-family DNA polymerase n=1 Tax=Vibrio sp. MACH09 TaxID=3025122 RepID=UPI00278F077E|nr:DNA polymerase Y family protein [Vibrio sp. MACH09]GLO60422.1 nucleotidyltransferase [Vibrio sp. MACH09]